MYNLDLSDDTPLYLQIVDQTKLAIASGLMAEGDRLPSIREMAKTLLVNQSTVTKAYRDLEAQGFIESVPGRGTFVSLDKGKIDLEKDNLKLRIKDIYRESLVYGLTKGDLEGLYKEVLEEEKE